MHGSPGQQDILIQPNQALIFRNLPANFLMILWKATIKRSLHNSHIIFKAAESTNG